MCSGVCSCACRCLHVCRVVQACTHTYTCAHSLNVTPLPQCDLLTFRGDVPCGLARYFLHGFGSRAPTIPICFQVLNRCRWSPPPPWLPPRAMASRNTHSYLLKPPLRSENRCLTLRKINTSSPGQDPPPAACRARPLRVRPESLRKGRGGKPTLTQV